MTRTGAFVTLALITLAGAAARFHHIGASSLATDEFLSLLLSNGHSPVVVALPVGVLLDPPPRPLTRLADARSWKAIWFAPQSHQTHPPLYFLLLRLWRHLFGDAETALRALSGLASLVALWLLFDTVRMLQGMAPALWATALMAVSPAQVLYAQETRNYALLAAAGLAACCSVIRLEKYGVSLLKLVALGGSVLVCALTHYLAWGALGGLLAYLVLRLRGAARRPVAATFGLAAAIAVASTAPAIFYNRSAATNKVGLLEHPDGHLLSTAARVASTPVYHLAANSRQALAPVTLSGALLLLILVGARRPDLRLWTLWWAGAVGLVAALDLTLDTSALSLVRFTLMASPATYALVAGSFRCAWARHSAPAAACVLALWHLPNAYEGPKAPWRPFASRVAPVLADGRPLVLWTEQENPGGLYMRLRHYAPDVGNPVLAASTGLSRPAGATLGSAFWVLSRSRPSLVAQGSTVRPVVRMAGVPTLWKVGEP